MVDKYYDTQFVRTVRVERALENLGIEIMKSLDIQNSADFRALELENGRLLKELEEARNIIRIYNDNQDKQSVQDAQDEERIYSILKKSKIVLWRASEITLYGPKCGKCNERRRVKITLPSGRKSEDMCECAKEKKKVFVPEKLIRYKIGEQIEPNYGDLYYSKLRGGRSFQYDGGEKLTTLETCKELCNRKNRENEVGSNCRYLLGGKEVNELYEG